MAAGPDLDDVAAALQDSIGMFLRRMRQLQGDGDLTLPEKSALGRLNRGGPATSSALAKLEQISPQSMGATLAALQVRGLVERHADPVDGRHVVLSVTEAGRQMLQHRRTERTAYVTRALAAEFTDTELDQLRKVAPLLERLALRL